MAGMYSISLPLACSYSNTHGPPCQELLIDSTNLLHLDEQAKNEAYQRKNVCAQLWLISRGVVIVLLALMLGQGSCGVWETKQ